MSIKYIEVGITVPDKYKSLYRTGWSDGVSDKKLSLWMTLSYLQGEVGMQVTDKPKPSVGSSKIWKVFIRQRMSII